MPDEKTPPTGTRLDPPPPEPPRPVPTPAAIYNLLNGVAGQLGGLRGDVDKANERLEQIEQRFDALPSAPSAPPGSSPASSDVLYIPTLPSPASLTPAPTPPRPSMAAKALEGTGKAVKVTSWGAVATSAVIGLLGLVSAIVKQKHPEATSVIDAIAKMLLLAVGGAP